MSEDIQEANKTDIVTVATVGSQDHHHLLTLLENLVVVMIMVISV